MNKYPETIGSGLDQPVEGTLSQTEAINSMTYEINL